MTHSADIQTARKIAGKNMKMGRQVGHKTSLSNIRELGHITECRTGQIETIVLMITTSPRLPLCLNSRP